MSTHNICFRGEIRKISTFFGWKKRLICCYAFCGIWSGSVLFAHETVSPNTLDKYGIEPIQWIGLDNSCKLSPESVAFDSDLHYLLRLVCQNTGILRIYKVYELGHSISYKTARAPREDSDQPVHPQSYQSPSRSFKKGSCQFLAKECAQYWLTA